VCCRRGSRRARSGGADAASKKRRHPPGAGHEGARADDRRERRLKGDITADRIKALETYGRVRDLIEPIDALTMQARDSDLDAIRSLPFVEAANRTPSAASPEAAALASDFSGGGIPGTRCGDVTTTANPVASSRRRGGRTLRSSTPGCSAAAATSRRSASHAACSRFGAAAQPRLVSEQPHKWQQDRTRTART